MHSADYAIGRCLSVRLSVLEMGMHEKIAPKRNIFGIWRRPLGATVPCHTFLETSFQGQHFHRRYYASILNRLKVTELQI